MFSLPIGMVWDGSDGSVVYQILPWQDMDWICRFIILIDAHSPVYFAMALEIVLNRREDGLVRLSDTAAGYNTLAHLWLLPNFKTFSPSRFRYWGSNGFDYGVRYYRANSTLDQGADAAMQFLLRLASEAMLEHWTHCDMRYMRYRWNWMELKCTITWSDFSDFNGYPPVATHLFLPHLHLEIGCFCSEDIAVQGAPGRTAEWCTTSHQQLELDGIPTSLPAGKWCTRLKSALQILSTQSFQEKLSEPNRPQKVPIGVQQFQQGEALPMFSLFPRQLNSLNM